MFLVDYPPHTPPPLWDMDLQAETAIVPYLARGDEALRVLEYQRQCGQRLIAVGNVYRYRFDLTKTRLDPVQGLTTVLKDLYWPTYTPKGRRGGTGPGKKRGRAVSTDPLKRVLEKAAETASKRRRLNRPMQPVDDNDSSSTTNKPVTPAVELAKGAVRGTLVHYHLSDFITLKRDEFDRRHPHPHPWVERVAKALIEMEIYPLATELPVIDPAMGVAFRLDLVCVRPSGRLVFVELKNSESRELFFWNEPPDAAQPELGLQGLARARCQDSDYTRAALEVGVGTFMAIQCLQLQCDFDTMIVLVTPSHIEFIQLPDDVMTDLIVDIYADMLHQVPERRALAQARKPKKPSFLVAERSSSSSSHSSSSSQSDSVSVGDPMEVDSF